MIICIMGPTGVGKTELAISLTQELPLEIISVDSTMVYRGLDIGSAKPTVAEQSLAPHRLIDIRDPKESYSAAQFCNDALRELENILTHNKIPLLVGGTMLYFKALLHGLSKLPAANNKLRAELTAEMERIGVEEMHQRLAKIDSAAAAKIKPADWQRIQRALEVYALTGQTMTTLQQQNKASKLHYPVLNIALIPEDRAQLQKNLAQRFKLMLQQGLVAEVEALYKRGDLNPELPALRSVGYRQVWQYLAGKLSYEEMQEQAIIATRQLAKRQLTWLRSWPDLNKFSSDDTDLYSKVKVLIDNICSRQKSY